MRTAFYPKLSWDSIRKNRRLYLPYILTCVGMVMMYYIICHLASMPALKHMAGGRTTRQMLSLGKLIIAVFSLIFLMYTNSFLMRRRQKEFGLYNILGMGKRNLSALCLWESIMVFGISLCAGLIAGTALSKLAELLLVRMLRGSITYEFIAMPGVMLDTAVVFALIFCLLFLKELFSLWRLNAVTLLKSENAGERPPRANYLLGIGGLILLIAAYAIAVSIKSPLEALDYFFVAVGMVIVATYMLFIAGSVMLCRILQKNKKYYYKKNHFVAVASMTYRMKRNGAGLASICILSTMVLVMMLGAGSLYFGVEDSLKSQYPRDISINTNFMAFGENYTYSSEKAARITSELDAQLLHSGVQAQDLEHYVSMTVASLIEDGKLIVSPGLVNAVSPLAARQVTDVFFIPLEDYNACMGANETLLEDEALLHGVRYDFSRDTLTLPDGTALRIKKQVDDIMGRKDAVVSIFPSVFLVVHDLESIGHIIEAAYDGTGYLSTISLHYGFNTSLSTADEIQLSEDIRTYLGDTSLAHEDAFYSYSVECRGRERDEYYATYGGVFYLGIILSVVFLLATVLIIYYKQITEGYEDESRFSVMQKVGMTRADIRRSINSQMLTVFLLPPVTAVMHLSFSFPMVKKLLELFNPNNTALMLIVLGISLLVFGVFYAVIYKCTSNVYYAIVSEQKTSG